MRCVSNFRICVLLLSAAIAAVTMGCNSATSNDPEVQVELSIKPSPPVVGDSDVTLTLTDAGGSPLQGAKVNLEGNMNHAGMKPSFAELEETQPGQYVGTLDFTMGGDWFILVNAKTQDGQTMERKIDVPGVKAE